MIPFLPTCCPSSLHPPIICISHSFASFCSSNIFVQMMFSTKSCRFLFVFHLFIPLLCLYYIPLTYTALVSRDLHCWLSIFIFFLAFLHLPQFPAKPNSRKTLCVTNSSSNIPFHPLVQLSFACHPLTLFLSSSLSSLFIPSHFPARP